MTNIPRLVISGTAGSSGKTLLALGIIRALSRRGLVVAPFKKGPDYIDAAWLGLAAGRACVNLDPFFSDERQLLALFAEGSENADVAIIEGNRGLYDGRDAVGTCSTAALARLLDAPVLLSLNCTKMTRTAAAVVAGIASFEPVRIAGVVLSQVHGARHEAVVRESISHYTEIPIFGALARLRPNPLPERHMGLAAADSAAGSGLELLADTVERNVDLDAVLSAARKSSPLCVFSLWDAPRPAISANSPCIGYVEDEALWFYYPENIEALRRAGAEPVRLSLFDAAPWPEIDGLYLGGGFPELLAERVSTSPKLAVLRQLSEAGMPVYAECGGFMILCESIVIDGKVWPMAGIFPAQAEFCRTPQGLGYVEARGVRESPFHPAGVTLRGHEFHYSRCRLTGEVTATLELSTGTGMGQKEKGACDGILVRNTFASYMHLFAPSVPHWAKRFAAACGAFRQKG